MPPKDMANPLVSIVIPVYNGADYLAQAIESALGQTYPNVEVLVINDGSCDEGATEGVAKGYQDRIRYIAQENGGVASALNRGIREMKGEYFSWLSHDDLYHPKKIEHQITLAQRTGNPRQLVGCGYLLFTDRDGVIGFMDIARMYPRERLETPLFPVFHCAVNGCTLLIHREHFHRVGLFDERRPTTQDYDLWFRMLRGVPLVFDTHIDVYSRVHDRQGSVVMLKQHESECTGLWNGMFDTLTEQEKIAMGGSLQGFADDMYRHFHYRTSYGQVCKHIQDSLLPNVKAISGFPPMRPGTAVFFSKIGFRRLRKRLRAADSFRI